MFDLSGEAYLWFKALHIIAAISWMAGLFYLPRLFIYHCKAEPGSESSETFKVMERRLLRAIMYPAMVATLLGGGVMILEMWSGGWLDGWLMSKLACVLGLVVMNFLLARWRLDFAADNNRHSEKFYRIINEVPTVFMIGIVILGVMRPF